MAFFPSFYHPHRVKKPWLTANAQKSTSSWCCAATDCVITSSHGPPLLRPPSLLHVFRGGYGRLQRICIYSSCLTLEPLPAAAEDKDYNSIRPERSSRTRAILWHLLNQFQFTFCIARYHKKSLTGLHRN